MEDPNRAFAEVPKDHFEEAEGDRDEVGTAV
jgi:hypothetical protein